MAYPAGVTTRSITFSTATDAEDGSTTTTVRTFVSLNETIVHMATGIPLLPHPNLFTAGFSLPVTDQDNIWSDGKGNSLVTTGGYHTHSYRVDLEYKPPSSPYWLPYKTLHQLVVPTSGDPLDLDLAFNINQTVYDA